MRGARAGDQDHPEPWAQNLSSIQRMRSFEYSLMLPYVPPLYCMNCWAACTSELHGVTVLHVLLGCMYLCTACTAGLLDCGQISSLVCDFRRDGVGELQGVAVL